MLSPEMPERIAVALGESPSNCSWHLRHLAGFELVRPYIGLTRDGVPDGAEPVHLSFRAFPRSRRDDDGVPSNR